MLLRPQFQPGKVLGIVALVIVPVAARNSHGIPIVFALALLGGMFASRWYARPLGPDHSLLLGLLALVVGWAGLSLAWGVGSGLNLVPALIATFLGGLVLVALGQRCDESERVLIGWALVGAMATGAMGIALKIASIQYELAHSPYGTILSWQVNPAVTILALMAWPAAFFLWRRGWRVGAGGLLAALLALTVITHCLSAGMALAAGGLVLALVRGCPSRGVWAVGALLAVAVLATPWVLRALPEPERIVRAIPSLPQSTVHRLYIWKGVERVVAERPWLGFGLNASRTLADQREAIFYDFWAGGRHFAASSPLIPLHPHNGPLQWWLELGAIGAMLGAAIILAIIRAIDCAIADPLARATAMAMLVGGYVEVSVSYGMWQGWWLCALFLVAALAAPVLTPANGAQR